MLSSSGKVAKFGLIMLAVLQVRWREKDKRIKSVGKEMIIVMNNRI